MTIRIFEDPDDLVLDRTVASDTTELLAYYSGLITPAVDFTFASFSLLDFGTTTAFTDTRISLVDPDAPATT